MTLEEACRRAGPGGLVAIGDERWTVKSERDLRKCLRHPVQPAADDGKGVLRFKPNAIVRHLLDHGPFDLNALALLDFTDEDREQFAQLIGYSVAGFGDLSYVRDETLERIG